MNENCDITLGLLGPDGTFTAEVGYNYVERRGLTPRIQWYKSIEDCFRAVEDSEVDRAVVPMLNSTADAGWVNQTLRGLRDNGIMIYDEQILPIRHHLAALPGVTLGEIEYIWSKDKAVQQCSRYLADLGKDREKELEVEYTSSTAAATTRIKEGGLRTHAAIVSQRAVDLYGLEVLARDIQDDPRNKTRFIVISKQDHDSTGDDKTTILFEFKEVEDAGLLDRILHEFSRRGISLRYIQSLPKNGSLDDFTFYCDINGHREGKYLKEAIEAVEKNVDLNYFKVLGSYPVYRKT